MHEPSPPAFKNDVTLQGCYPLSYGLLSAAGLQDGINETIYCNVSWDFSPFKHVLAIVLET